MSNKRSNDVLQIEPTESCTIDWVYYFTSSMIRTGVYYRAKAIMNGVKISITKKSTREQVAEKYAQGLNMKDKIESSSAEAGFVKIRLPIKKVGH